MKYCPAELAGLFGRIKFLAQSGFWTCRALGSWPASGPCRPSGARERRRSAGCAGVCWHQAPDTPITGGAQTPSVTNRPRRTLEPFLSGTSCHARTSTRRVCHPHTAKWYRSGAILPGHLAQDMIFPDSYRNSQTHFSNKCPFGVFPRRTTNLAGLSVE